MYLCEKCHTERGNAEEAREARLCGPDSVPTECGQCGETKRCVDDGN